MTVWQFFPCPTVFRSNPWTLYRCTLIYSRYSPLVLAPVQSCSCTGDASRVLHLVYSGKFFYPFMKWIYNLRPFVNRVILAASIGCVGLSVHGCPAVSSVYQSSAVLSLLHLYLNLVWSFPFYQRQLVFCSIHAIVAALSASPFLSRSVCAGE
jgi:hypothetical protein